ncbi:MAG TPA: AbrB/MazE/SpoVT family DNA-binding domain-containing protein [Clostridiaceae bacterium]|nr:AbrB/MazE/SpoVT family DNA-binding domain-containing protein [Clostridiaceae bacterium]
MNLAKVSSNGQVTIPKEVRRELGLKPGDKVLFLTNERGEMTIRNASLQAVYKAQDAFVGVAEEMAVYGEEDVQKLVDEVRYKK